MNSKQIAPKINSDLFSIRDSQFAKQIQQVLNDRNKKEAFFNFLLYANLLSFIATLLALYGLTFIKTAILMGAGLLLLTVNLVLVRLYAHQKKTRIHIWLSSLRTIIYDGILASTFFFILISETTISPLVAILAILASSLASLAFSSRSVVISIISKGILFAVAAIYGVIANDGSYSTISIVFPIIIFYTLLSTMLYWLHIRQIRQIHNLLQQQYLHNKLEREQELRKRLFLYIGHDLRQPINALGILLHSAQEQSEIIDDAKQCVRSSKRLIDDIVQIATYQGEQLVVNVSKFSINKLLTNIEQEYATDALAKNCDLRIVACSLSIRNDFQLVSRTIKNFVANAITHAPGKKILIGVRRRKNTLEIQVHDQGPGIADDEQSLIFTEFSQGSNGHKESGFGLGLTIAKHFVETCNGQIIFNSGVGRGSMFGVAYQKD